MDSFSKSIKNCKLGIVIQARMGSSRLPGKVLMPFVGSKSILDLIIDNVKSVVQNKYEIVIATSNSNENSILEKYALEKKVLLFKGDENDVLSRFIETGIQFGYTHILRICADNPFLSKYFLNGLISEWESSLNDYLSFKMFNETPIIKSHIGLFTEIVSFKSLQKAKGSTNKNNYLENVTEYIYEHPSQFDINFLKLPEFISQRSDLRFTVDDIEDFQILSEIYKKCNYDDNIEELIFTVDNSSVYNNHMIDNIKKYTK